MKNSLMKFTAIIVGIIVCLIITGKSDTQVSFRKVGADYTTGKVKAFIQSHINKTEQEAYVYKENNRTMYLLLNGNKNKAPEYLKDIKIVPNGNTINISYNVVATDARPHKKNVAKLLYRIKLHRDFAKIKLYKNGTEIKQI